MSDVARQIEAFLLEHRGGVNAAVLCERFGVKERALRGLNGEPGLIGVWAVRGDKGFRHVQHATMEERDRCCQRLRKHGLGEWVLARDIRRRWNNVRKPKAVPPMTREGQTLLFSLQ